MSPSPRAYILCTAPRSGSTMLCGMLRGTGVAGRPESYFHRPDLVDWARGLGLPDGRPLPDILGAVRATATKGVCGVRLQDHSRGFFLKAISAYGTTDPERIQAALGPTRYIWLRRRDKLAQAISLIRAEQTGLWHRNSDGTDLERIAPSGADGFDPDAIAEQIKAFETADRDWLNWFADHGITPWSLAYEDLVADPPMALRMILIHLGLDQRHADQVTVPTQKLADATSDHWAKMYLAMRGDSP